MNLKRLIASSCRQRLLEELAKAREMNVMHLVRRINSTYNDVQRNLKIFEEEGLIVEKRFGRHRLIGLDRENPKVKTLLQVLKTMDKEDGG